MIARHYSDRRLSRHDRKVGAGRRLADVLRSEILDGQVATGVSMPSEAELSVRHGVGRNVVRTALDLLRRDGYITRKPGTGTIVVSDRVSCPIGPVAGITAVFDGGGHRVITRFRDVGVVAAPEWVATRLEVEVGEPCLAADYETVVDREPYALATSYLPQDLAADRFDADLAGDWFGDWFSVLAQLGFDMGEMRLRIEATVADEYSAARLGVMPGAPLLRFERLVTDDLGRPLDVGFSRCRADRVVVTNW